MMIKKVDPSSSIQILKEWRGQGRAKLAGVEGEVCVEEQCYKKGKSAVKSQGEQLPDRYMG